MKSHRSIIFLFLSIVGIGSAFCAKSAVPREVSSSGGETREGAYRTPPRLEDGWQPGTPEELGLRRAPLEQMTEAVRRGDYANVHSVLIVKDGRLVYEEYFEGLDRRWLENGTRQEVSTVFDRETLHDLRSVTKSVTSALFGLVMDGGRIESLDQPLADFFPQYPALAEPEKEHITLRHVLTMSAGFDWNETRVAPDGGTNHETIMYTKEDPAGYVLGRPMVNEPGETWNYSGGLTTLLGYVAARASGQSLGELARQKLFEPLGITQVEWGWAGVYGQGRVGRNAWRGIPELRWRGTEPWSAVASPCAALWLLPRDLLKVGSLYLNQGSWNGQQVLPQNWVEESLQNHIDRPDPQQVNGQGASSRYGYGYQWWHDHYQLPYGEVLSQAAYGLGGQRIWVIPELALTAVQLAGNYDDWKASYQAERLLLEHIVPWALGVEATYEHQVSRPVLRIEPGEWAPATLSEEERVRYVGVYDQAGDHLEISDEGGVLQLTLPVVGVVQLIPDGDHTFAVGTVEDNQPRDIYWPSARMVFVLDDGGDVLQYEWVDGGEVGLVGKRMDPPD